jgi:hypothetical protein
MFPTIKKLNLSFLKTRWHLGRRGSKSVNKHVPKSCKSFVAVCQDYLASPIPTFARLLRESSFVVVYQKSIFIENVLPFSQKRIKKTLDSCIHTILSLLLNHFKNNLKLSTSLPLINTRAI